MLCARSSSLLATAAGVSFCAGLWVCWLWTTYVSHDARTALAGASRGGRGGGRGRWADSEDASATVLPPLNRKRKRSRTRFEVEEELNKLDQSDPRLIEILKNEILVSPMPENSPERRELMSKNSNYHSTRGQYGQPVVIDALFNHKKNGFFVEVGAHDGLSMTNTLFEEVERNWTGLLIESNPSLFGKLTKSGRNATLLPACVSTRSTPETVQFQLAINSGIAQPGKVLPGDLGNRLAQPLPATAFSGGGGDDGPTLAATQCFPLYSALMALGNPTVHHFSLDVEGAEMPVLRSIPFDKVDIRLIQVEVTWLGKIFPGSKEDLTKFLKGKGYEFLGPIGKVQGDQDVDWLFAKEEEGMSKRDLRVNGKRLTLAEAASLAMASDRGPPRFS